MDANTPAYRESKDVSTPTPVGGGFDLGSTSWHSYPSLLPLGHRALDRLFARPVIVEEKVDGSQFSFGWFPEKQEKDGLGLLIKSKGAFIHHEAPPALFKKAVETVKKLCEAGRLVPNWTYRGEVLSKPKHNTLYYERTPIDNIIIFDVNPGHEAYLGIEARKKAADDLGLETVPVLFVGDVSEAAQLRKYFETISVLGGQKVEGVVVKPLNRDYFGEDHKLLMGKFVSEEFKEAHVNEWGKSNPGRKDVLQLLIAGLTTQARWQKAVIHLKEKELIKDTPADIGLLVKEVQADILKEETQTIKDALFKAFRDEILRGTIRGLPEWYKNTLLTLQFEREMETEVPVASTEGQTVGMADWLLKQPKVQ